MRNERKRKKNVDEMRDERKKKKLTVNEIGKKKQLWLDSDTTKNT